MMIPTFPTQPARIMVGISGGVDSAVTAFLLQKAGHEVVPVFMQNWQAEENGECTQVADMQAAQAVCEHLKLQLQVVNFCDEYWEHVFAYFLAEYRAGRTPNPDVLCNKEIKFRYFLQHAKQLDADWMATGHYVQIDHSQTMPRLRKGIDDNKDQSYFLSMLSAAQLQKSITPLGHLHKTTVRDIAKEIGLPNYARKDSTGICFIGERKFKTFLENYLPAQPGDIKNLQAEKIGEHDGLMFYTIGQRQGLHIGGRKDALDAPWYVAKKDLTTNTLYVVQGSEHPALYQRTLRLSQLHWINHAPTLPITLQAKTRYRQADQTCTLSTTNEPHIWEVTFREPQRAITPGQVIVFYQEDICLGSGIIEA